MHYLVAPRPTPNDLKNQGGSIHLCNARARSNVAVATSTALPERILDLRGIDRLVLAQQRAEKREVLHRHGVGAEQIVRLHESRDLRLRTSVQPRQSHVRLKPSPFGLQSAALQRCFDLGSQTIEWFAALHTEP